MTEDAPTAHRTAETCSFTSGELNLPSEFLSHFGIENWRCSRPVWNDDPPARCVWHAAGEQGGKPPELLDTTINDGDLHGAVVPSTDLTEINLPNAGLVGANLSGTTLFRTDLSEATLFRADLSKADLRDADLSEADLRDADLSEAMLERADFWGADLRGADLTDAFLAAAEMTATLERANLTRADLFNTDLSGAAFYGAVTTDAQLSETTTFGDHYTGSNQSVGDDDSQQARWCLRRIERLAEANALPDQSREAFLQRRKLRRQEAKTEREWGEWTLLTAAQWVMGYGESFGRVLRTAAVIILTSALLYPRWGVETSASQRLTYPEFQEALTSPLDYTTVLADTLLTSLYFSVLTFTTLGFGDLQPVGLGRALATFEAGAGVTLFALLVFVLGRRSTR